MTGILLSFVYMLKTGSRGCLLSSVVLFAVSFWVSKRKLQVATIALPVLAIGFALMPSRFSPPLFVDFHSGPPSATLPCRTISTIQSTMEREELFKRSLEYTITHPLFGVGAGQFAVALTGDAAQIWRVVGLAGNTQFVHAGVGRVRDSSISVLCRRDLLTFRRSYGLYRAVAGRPQFREIEGLAFCLFAGILVYSIGTFFFHMAYTGLLPLLSGHAVALAAAAKPVLASANERRAA